MTTTLVTTSRFPTTRKEISAMYGRVTSTEDCMRRSHRRHREGDVCKLPTMTDDGSGVGGGGGGADRLRRPKRYHLPHSQSSVEEEEEEGCVAGVDLSSSRIKKQRAWIPQVKNFKANEESSDFTKVLSSSCWHTASSITDSLLIQPLEKTKGDKIHTC